MVSRQTAVRAALCALMAGMIGLPPRAAAQARGSIEFLAQATPASGIDEPVRGFPFYLLSRSFDEITNEAEASDPAPNMNAFIDTLDVSKELKAWMKKNHRVRLSGDDLLSKLTPEDVATVPEFCSAYIARSIGGASPDFPKAKFKAVDKSKEPAKYERLSADYHQAVQRFIEQNPQSKDGMELELADQDPSPQWEAQKTKRAAEVRRRTMELAQSKYLVARTETNLEGRGFFNGVPAGTYWLSTLALSAEVGDVRSRWDVPVTVPPGQTAYLVLSNVNAVQPSRNAP